MRGVAARLAPARIGTALPFLASPGGGPYLGPPRERHPATMDPGSTSPPEACPPPAQPDVRPLVLGPAELVRAGGPGGLYDRPGPLVLEIGFGNGDFLAQLASTHPDWNFLGAEISPGSVVRARATLQRLGLRNVRLFRGNARFLLREAIAERSLTRVHVNFPDPWPKDRHADNRLLQAPFLRLLSTRLVDGGELLLTTDHPGYFAQAEHEARSTGLYRVSHAPPPAETLRTKYARKWRAQDKSIHHLVLVLARRDPAPPDARIEIGTGMHFAHLSGTLPEPQTFEKQVRLFAGGCAIALDVLRATRGGGFDVLVRIEELDLIQEILVEVAPRDGDGVRVAVRQFGQPLPTRGTREAVALVTAWLEDQGLELRQRSF